MLKTRIITALFMVPPAFALIFLADMQWFALGFAIFMVIGSWEFRRLGGLDKSIFGWLMVIIQAALLFFLYQYSEAMILHAPAILTAGCLVWILMFLRLVVFRAGTAIDFQYRIVSFFCSIAALTFTWIALYTLRSEANGSWWILLLLLIISSADTGAYFIGRAFGKTKLAPKISPSKTMAGFIGGLFAAVFVSFIVVFYIPEIEISLQELIPLTIITALVSVGGDLFISLHKRKTGYKDSGRIFPGHGGVLDRFDSLMAGAPFFVLAKLLMGF